MSQTHVQTAELLRTRSEDEGLSLVADRQIRPLTRTADSRLACHSGADRR